MPSDTDQRLKSFRLLQMCSRLQDGQVINKADAAREYGVNERSIQRDIEDLRDFFGSQMPIHDVVYDAKARGYRLTAQFKDMLSNSEVFAVCKILLESRSMIHAEMGPILGKLISRCVPEYNKKAVQELIANEQHHYIEPRHGRTVLDKLWELGQAIDQYFVVEIEYQRIKEPQLVKRTVEPVGIMFSEYYFYLTAFLRDVDRTTAFENADDANPTIYRIDRIRSVKVLKEHFHVPYGDRFQEGEFRKQVQFMYGGRLERIKFRYSGPSLEAVLDRLPTAKVLSREGDSWIVSAEVFGKGIDMWLRSQGDMVEVLE